MERKVLLDLLVKNICNQNKELDATLYQVKTDICTAIKNENIEESRQMIADAKSILPILFNNTDKNKSEYLVGKYVGWIEVLDELVNVEYAEYENFKKSIDRIRPEDKEYIEPILSYLESNVFVRSEKLMENLKIDKEILQDMLSTFKEGGLIISFIPGKDTYYLLTDRGKKYLRDIKSN